MSIAPIVTFKAGLCDYDPESGKVKPNPTRGYIYLYSEDDLIHFCWRPRSAQLENPELDLVMVPSDGTFKPLEGGPSNGRIYVLRFSSSSQKHLFWLQSKAQDHKGRANHWSARDKRLGTIVNNLLQGEDVNVQAEIASTQEQGGGDDGDDDATMEDVEGTNHDSEHHRGGSGGAGPDATGGDVREEGQEAREGGADGGRAAALPQDASAVVQNFLRSMGNTEFSQQQQQQNPTQEHLFTTLAELLTPASTLSVIDQAGHPTVDRYLDFLPPSLLTLAQEPFDDASTVDTTLNAAAAAKEALSLSQKKDILHKVLRSPQFTQSLSSLTIALRDGGLPSIAEALGVSVTNGGYMRRGGVPLGGGDAVEAFVEGVKKQVEQEGKGEGGTMDQRGRQEGKMDVD